MDAKCRRFLYFVSKIFYISISIVLCKSISMQISLELSLVESIKSSEYRKTFQIKIEESPNDIEYRGITSNYFDMQQLCYLSFFGKQYREREREKREEVLREILK